jgi:hypothetical protein
MPVIAGLFHSGYLPDLGGIRRLFDSTVVPAGWLVCPEIWRPAAESLASCANGPRRDSVAGLSTQQMLRPDPAAR